MEDVWERGSGAGGRVSAYDPAKAGKQDTRQNGESGKKARTWHGIGMGHQGGPIGCQQWGLVWWSPDKRRGAG